MIALLFIKKCIMNIIGVDQARQMRDRPYTILN